MSSLMGLIISRPGTLSTTPASSSRNPSLTALSSDSKDRLLPLYPSKVPCYRCLYEAPPPPGLVPSCQEAGVLGVLPGVVGSIQATEVVKLILGKGEILKGKLLIYDSLNMDFKKVKIHKNPNCPVCGDNATIKELIDYEEFCHAHVGS